MANSPDVQQFFDFYNGLSPADRQAFDTQYGGNTTTPVTGIGGPTSTPGTGTDVSARNREMFDMMTGVLSSAGLGELFTVDANGNPGGWLWDQITKGVDSQAALQLAFEQTPQFQQRFPVIKQRRDSVASGKPGYVPSPKDVLNYELEVSTMLRQAGAPAWFYDDRQQLQQLMGQDLSAAEVRDRVGSAWTMVRNTDPNVQAAFKDFFGIDGDAAMLAMFLDPQTTMSSLERAARTAYTAGMGKTMGIDLDKQYAERIAALPKTEGGITQDLQQVSSMVTSGGVFDEGITETTDLTTNTGIEAVALGSGQAQADIRRRIAERSANDRSSTGGAALTQRGFTGIGSS